LVCSGDKEGQVLVDAAYVAESFLRAYDTLWEPLDDVTKQRYIDNFISLRWINPVYSNWLLFTATIETFLQKAAGCGDTYRLNSTLRKINEWYVGDGWYADGIVFSFDYYNSYVIHPMYVECLDVLTNYGERRDYAGCRYDLAWNRLQRYGAIVERLISPEGTFPVFGRSITYRCAVLQPLAMLALRESLPEGLSEGQVRAAITAVAKRMFSDNRNYNDGWLSDPGLQRFPARCRQRLHQQRQPLHRIPGVSASGIACKPFFLDISSREMDFQEGLGGRCIPAGPLL